MNRSTNPPAAKVKKEIANKSSKATKETQVFRGIRYELARIELPIDYLYYNLENVRTEDDCEQYLKDNPNSEESIFKIKNVFNRTSQEAYHPIIFKHAKNKIKEYDQIFQQEKSDQRIPIYISHDGIIVNGNTRVAYWKEFKPAFNPILCLVFDDTVSWRDLLYASNHMDSGVDITQKMNWFNRAKQARRFLKADTKIKGSPLKPTERLVVANGSQYTRVKEMDEALSRLKLAEDFLSSGYAGYRTFEDMKEGGKYNFQAFKDMQVGLDKKLPGISEAVIDHNIVLSHDAIIKDGKIGKGYPSTHKALEFLWGETNLRLMQKKLGLVDEDPMQPDEKPAKRKKEKPTKTELDKILKEGALEEEVKKQKKLAIQLAQIIQDMADQLKRNRESLIDDETDSDAALEALDNLSEEIKLTKKTLKGKK